MMTLDEYTAKLIYTGLAEGASLSDRVIAFSTLVSITNYEDPVFLREYVDSLKDLIADLEHRVVENPQLTEFLESKTAEYAYACKRLGEL